MATIPCNPLIFRMICLKCPCNFGHISFSCNQLSYHSASMAPAEKPRVFELISGTCGKTRDMGDFVILQSGNSVSWRLSHVGSRYGAKCDCAATKRSTLKRSSWHVLAMIYPNFIIQQVYLRGGSQPRPKPSLHK